VHARWLHAAFLLIALATSASASAVTLARNGIGQALIYPFYTVDNSQDTLISVVNPTEISKAVQVSFLEGHAGQHVLDLIVFLRPHDVWTAAVSQISDTGGARLHTSDTSCTLPPVPTDGLDFSSASYDGSSGQGNDGGPFDITRLREGLINLIAGGDIVPASPTDLAITHRVDFIGGVAPPDCASLDPVHFYSDLVAPTGGIYGSGSVINVGVGTLFAYNADALADFTRTMLFHAFTHVPPSLEDANTGSLFLGVNSQIVDESGRPLFLAFNDAITAVSSVFMADAIYNDYLVDASLGAASDWVITFPTKHYLTGNGDPIYVDVTVSDREAATTNLRCSDCYPTQWLSYEVNVAGVRDAAHFNASQRSDVFGSTLNTLFLPPSANAGSIKISFYFPLGTYSGGPPDYGAHILQVSDADGAPVNLHGVPVTGFMAYTIINAQAQPGQLANYGGTFRHRATVSCSGPPTECAEPIPPGN